MDQPEVSHASDDVRRGFLQERLWVILLPSLLLLSLVGATWLTLQTIHREEVQHTAAIKVVNLPSSDHLRRFKVEWQALAKLSHANIARVLARFKASGSTWLLTTHFTGIDHNADIADGDWRPLNLCRETIDGVRNHSWSRPAPATPEGEVVSWADRIAYVCHDFEDAVAAGIVSDDMLPPIVQSRIGTDRSTQLGTLVRAMVQATAATGRIGMVAPVAEALAEFRRFNYEHVYLRPASVAQADAVIALLRALVEHYADRPNLLPDGHGLDADSPEALRCAVTYVGGMTDRFACRQALALLGWDRERLPIGIDV